MLEQITRVTAERGELIPHTVKREDIFFSFSLFLLPRWQIIMRHQYCLRWTCKRVHSSTLSLQPRTPPSLFSLEHHPLSSASNVHLGATQHKPAAATYEWSRSPVIPHFFLQVCHTILCLSVCVCLSLSLVGTSC